MRRPTSRRRSSGSKPASPPSARSDDRFVDAFTIAGTAEQCRERIDAYGRAGVSELVLTFVAAQPVAEIEYLGRALKSG